MRDIVTLQIGGAGNSIGDAVSNCNGSEREGDVIPKPKKSNPTPAQLP